MRILFIALLLMFNVNGSLILKNTNGGIIELSENGDLYINGKLSTSESVFNSTTNSLKIKKNGEVKCGIYNDELKIKGTEVDVPESNSSMRFKYRDKKNDVLFLNMSISSNGNLFTRGDLYSPEYYNLALIPAYTKTKTFSLNNTSESVTYYNALGGEIQKQQKLENAKYLIESNYINKTQDITVSSIPQITFGGFQNRSNKRYIDLANSYYSNRFEKPVTAISVTNYEDSPLHELKDVKLVGEEGFEAESKRWAFGVESSTSFLPQSTFDVENDSWVVGVGDDSNSDYLLEVLKNADGNYSQIIYDATGNVVAECNYTGSEEIITTCSYNENQQLEVEYFPMHQKNNSLDMYAKSVYNDAGLLVSHEDPDAGITQYFYDDNLRIERVVSPKETYDYIYGRMGQVKELKVNGAVRSKMIYSKSDFNELKSLFNTSIELDELWNKIKISRGSLIAELSISQNLSDNYKTLYVYSYTPLGQIEYSYSFLIKNNNIANAISTKASYKYDIDGSLLESKLFQGLTFSELIEKDIHDVKFEYTYNNLNAMKYLKIDGETAVEFKYDEIGKLVQKVYYTSNGNNICNIINYNYNEQGNVCKIESPNLYSQVITNYEKNGDTYRGSLAGNIYKTTHSYLNTGKTINLKYGYDKVGRLTSVESDYDKENYSEAFRYNLNGALLQKVKGVSDFTITPISDDYVYKSENGKLTNKLTTAKKNIKRFEYDGKGNIVKDLEEKTIFEHNYLNLPVKSTIYDDLDNTSTENTTVEMVYDHGGKRVLNRVDKQGVGVTETIYLGGMIFKKDLGEIDYIHTNTAIPFGLGTVSHSTINDVAYYKITDHQGSTRLTFDNTGKWQNSYLYDAYGKYELISGGGDKDTRDKYTGKEYDEDISKYYFGARFFDPEIGVFTSVDPVSQYFNRYSFCGGDPINLVDSDGMKADRAKYLEVNGSYRDLFDYIHDLDPSTWEAFVTCEEVITTTTLLLNIEVLEKYGFGDKNNVLWMIERFGVTPAGLEAPFFDPVNIATGYAASKIIRGLMGGSAAKNTMTLYRGDKAGLTFFKSKAAQQGGYKYAKDIIAKSNLDDLMIQHAKTSKGSPFISFTTDPKVAKSFAGPNGQVYKLQVPTTKAIKNIHNTFGESEWLIQLGIQIK